MLCMLLVSDVNVDFVCLSVCLSVMDRRTYGIATAHASHFFARGSIEDTCTVLISEVLRKPMLEVSICDPSSILNG